MEFLISLASYILPQIMFLIPSMHTVGGIKWKDTSLSDITFTLKQDVNIKNNTVMLNNYFGVMYDKDTNKPPDKTIPKGAKGKIKYITVEGVPSFMVGYFFRYFLIAEFEGMVGEEITVNTIFPNEWFKDMNYQDYLDIKDDDLNRVLALHNSSVNVDNYKTYFKLTKNKSHFEKKYLKTIRGNQMVVRYEWYCVMVMIIVLILWYYGYLKKLINKR